MSGSQKPTKSGLKHLKQALDESLSGTSHSDGAVSEISGGSSSRVVPQQRTSPRGGGIEKVSSSVTKQTVTPRKGEKKNPTSGPNQQQQSSKMRPTSPKKAANVASRGKHAPQTKKAQNANKSRSRPYQQSSQEESEEEASPAAVQQNFRKKGAAKRKQATSVMRSIIKLQSTTTNQIPCAPFQRLVRELMQKASPVDFRLTSQALEAMREATETYVTKVLADANLIALNRRQVTIFPRDIQLVMFLRGARG